MHRMVGTRTLSLQTCEDTGATVPPAMTLCLEYMGERGYWTKEQNQSTNDPKAASSIQREKQLHVRS